MKTLFPVVFTDALADASEFYRGLFGFEVVVEISWYVHLCLPTDETIQIAFVASDHYSVPDRFHSQPAGVAISLEFDDVDIVFARAKRLGLPIHVELRDETWGQRHFITEDPTGLMVDVVQPIAPTHEFLLEHGLVDDTVGGTDDS